MTEEVQEVKATQRHFYWRWHLKFNEKWLKTRGCNRNWQLPFQTTGLQAENVSFCLFVCLLVQPRESRVKESGNYINIGLWVPIILCLPLSYTDVVVERKWKTAWLGTPSCEVGTADAPVRSKSEVWKHFAFSVLRKFNIIPSLLKT